MKLKWNESNNVIVLVIVGVALIPILFGIAWFIGITQIVDEYIIEIDNEQYVIKEWKDGMTTVNHIESYWQFPISSYEQDFQDKIMEKLR